LSDPIRIYVQELVNEYMQDYAKEDAKKIIDVILPEIDRLISDRIKLHIVEFIQTIEKGLNIKVQGEK
jgi:hypothetical protein